MRNGFMVSIWGVVVLISPALMLAQNAPQPKAAPAKIAKTEAAPRTADGKPDLSGVWGPPSHGERMGYAAAPKQPISLTKWAQDKYEYNRDPGSRNLNNPHGRTELDPALGRCWPMGPMRLMTRAEPYEIIMLPKRVIFFFERDSEIRQIWMDGRGHPPTEELEHTWNGHSIGKWDGDTLVIDTVGLNSKTWLDQIGHVHSDKLHLVERIRRVSRDTLQIETTYEDPVALQKPWVQDTTLELKPDWEINEMVYCDDRYTEGIYPGGF